MLQLGQIESRTSCGEVHLLALRGAVQGAPARWFVVSLRSDVDLVATTMGQARRRFQELVVTRYPARARRPEVVSHSSAGSLSEELRTAVLEQVYAQMPVAAARGGAVLI